jgi:hypothetical protein
MGFSSFSGSGSDPYGGMTPADALGGGLTQTDPATGAPRGQTSAFPGMMDQSSQAYNMFFDQTYRPGMNSDLIREQFYAMTPEQQASYATPGNKYEAIGIAPSGGTQPSPGMPTGQYPNLMQNPAFNPAAGQPQQTPISTPPTLAQQIASPAPGAQQLINQLSPPPPRPALSQPPQMAAPMPTPTPVTQQPVDTSNRFSWAAPEIKIAQSPAVNMDFLRAPGQTPPPTSPAPAPFTPPPPEPGNRFSWAAPEIKIAQSPAVNMDFLRAPAAAAQPQPNPFAQSVIRTQPAVATRPVAQPQPMPTQATQGYVSRVPARGAYIAPRTPAPAPKPVAKTVAKPAPKPAPAPAPKPVAKAVAKAPARPVKR